MAKRPEVKPKLQEIAARAGVTVPWERITINRWKPDTCRCVIEQWFDDDAKPRVIAYANILLTCPEHTAKGETLWNTINGENQRKNKTLAMVESVISLQAREEDTTWAFSSVRLSGSDERVLEVTIAKATSPEKSSVQSASDIQFGPGAVVII